MFHKSGIFSKSYTESGTMCTTWLTSACFLFQDFFLSWIKSTILLLHHNALAILYIKSNSGLFWFIVHALLKWYLYLQYLQSSFPDALTHIQTHPHSHPRRSPTHPHRADVRIASRIRQLLGDKSCWFFFSSFFFFWKEKSMGNAFGQHNAN